MHGDIQFEVVQLSRVKPDGTGLDDADLGGWSRLLREASLWREVPEPLNNRVLEEAMNVLNEFRTDGHLNQIYRGRLQYERIRAAELGELEDARAERDAALAAALAAETEKQIVLAREARLAARLRALGVDPEEV